MGPLLTRRKVLLGTGAAAASLLGVRVAGPRFLRPGPVRSLDELSPAARALVATALEGLDAAKLWDAHAHVVGLDGSTGCWVNERQRSHAHPLERLRFEIYIAASGVADLSDADRQYRERLLALHRAWNPAGKLLALAFDQRVAEDGTELPERSPFHTPNDYVLALAADHADVVACGSVHPYRTDALARLEALAEGGALAVKWLPNAMGIDPGAARCQAFYERMAELRLVLLTHTGLEKAVHSAEDQALGNPLLLRRALDAGVTVVAAHCASLGSDLDLDARPDEEGERPRRESFELFLRVLAEEGRAGRFFGDLSAMTLIHRSGRPLEELLASPELHASLVNGSDYPLPAIDPLISLRLLARRGLLEDDERGALRELFEANPLLFDFVLKRRLRRRAPDGAVQRFADGVFETQRLFERVRGA